MNCKTVAAVSLGLVIGLVASYSLRQSESQGQVGQEKQAWEYKVVAFVVDDSGNQNAPDHLERINSLAAEGWEYVGLLCAGPHPYYTHPSAGYYVNSLGNVLFKRPKK